MERMTCLKNRDQYLRQYRIIASVIRAADASQDEVKSAGNTFVFPSIFMKYCGVDASGARDGGLCGVALNKLLAFQDKEPVKGITDIRRCSKSSLPDA